MGIIELNGHLVGEFAPCTLRLLESSYNIEQRCSNPEVLLLQSKLFSSIEVVVRVQHGGNGLSTLLVTDRAIKLSEVSSNAQLNLLPLIITAIKLLEIKLATCGLRRPQAQVIGSWGVKPRNWHIICHSLDDLAAFP